MKKPDFTKEQLDWLIDKLRLPCCHVTGEHDPTHFVDRKYICDIQIAKSWERLVVALGLAEVVKQEPYIDSVRITDDRIQPRPESGCGWCSREGIKGPLPVKREQ